ncbi:MAG TPA: flagellar hook-associated protein FlgK, partial [Oscillatoriaceae cyanobacterium]
QSEVNDINTLTAQIASLNQQVTTGVAAGMSPNDLQDARDQAINQLSQKLGINVVEDPTSGALNVFLNGQPLVNGNNSFQLQAAPVLANGFFQINYAPTGQQAQVTGGELNALLNLRNTTLSDTQPGGFINDVNSLASNLMTAVNTIHSASFGLDGVTTLPFFTGTDASDMQVNPAIMAPPDGLRLIAAATNDPGSLSGGPGDGGAALAIADLQNQAQAGLGNATIDSFYQNIITSAGTQGQQSSNQLTTQQQLVQTITQQQSSISGVNSDEEMANVVTAQKAYEASARVMSTIDQMLETLMNIQ